MITVILCAAGRGERAGFSENKILKELNGLRVLCYSLSAFSFADEILITCRSEDELRIKNLLTPYPQARTVRGGALRAESVYLALQEAQGEIVLVHDAARPFIQREQIESCLESVRLYGSGVCAVPAVDTTVLAKAGKILSTPDRSTVFSVQTPQGFLKDELLSAYRRAFAEKREAEFTDDSGIYAAYIGQPRLCEGGRVNKKLTYAEDFSPAARAGFGVDTHAFGAPLDHIVLGGVKIPSESGLVAHSDGDVLVHALMDALLSAAGLYDIGTYFPDTDERFLNADSMELLKEVLRLVRERGFLPQNVSVSVLAERPRLAPYIDQIKASLSNALNISPDAVGVAAGTNEKLGYVGEGKGITVYATVLLRSLPSA